MFDPSEILRVLSVALIPGIFAITLHEVAHGWAARQLGDPTAYMLGRLTLNPIKHVDPVGTVAVPLVSNEGLVYEYACHEGNHGLRNILSQARTLEKASGRQ